jgi:hypothetical protein
MEETVLDLHHAKIETHETSTQDGSDQEGHKYEDVTEQECKHLEPSACVFGLDQGGVAASCCMDTHPICADHVLTKYDMLSQNERAAPNACSAAVKNPPRIHQLRRCLSSQRSWNAT